MDFNQFSLKDSVHKYSNLAFKISVILVILAIFFLFSNITTDFYEPLKYLVLLIVVGFLFILMTIRFTFAGKTSLIRTPLDIPFLLLMAVGVVSTVMSTSSHVSLLGLAPKLQGSLVVLITSILFYFLIANFVKSKKDASFILSGALIAAAVLSIVTLLAYTGLKLLPDPWTHGINFTTTGSSFATAGILILLLPFVISNILTHTNLIWRVINSIFLALFAVTIVLTSNVLLMIAGLIALVLSYITLGPIRDIKTLSIDKLTTLALLGMPTLIAVILAIFSLLPPIGGMSNPLYQRSQNFPRELQLDFVTSWKVAVSSFRDAPFWGTGPSSFLFNFTSYKPIEFNSSKFWNVRFDSAFNEYMNVLATLGGVGFIALLSAAAMFVSSAVLNLKKGDALKVSLGVSGILFFTILAIHSAGMVFWVFGLIILALFFAVSINEEHLSEHTNRSLGGFLLRMTTSPEPSVETIKIEALPSVLVVISIAVSAFVIFFAGKYTLADINHRQALNLISQNNLVEAYNKLVKAEQLNPQYDQYRTDIAQVNLALANALVVSKGPTAENPQGSITDQDRQTIQTLLQQTIAEARTATTLSPRSALNWEVLGLLYRQIAGVAENALVFSLDAYGRAIFKDPLNPILRLNVGGVYYAVGNYDTAIRFFSDAANLKPDYPNAYYNLSVALKDKGDMSNAVAMAQKTLELVETDSPDYQVASDYLKDLQNRKNFRASAKVSQLQYSQIRFCPNPRPIRIR